MFRNLLIVVAVFGLGWGASFGAGVAFGRRTAPTAAAAAPTGGAQVQVQAGGGGQGGQGAQGSAPGGGQVRATAGTIERMDGQTMVLAAAQGGQPTRVTLTGQTQILKQAPGTTADLSAGTTVTVQAQGQPAPDGTLTAATIMIGGPGGPGGPGGAPPQRPANAAQPGR
ncbi:MAG TPA: hypothetical protein VFN74_16155 [Chloroflexota bacterium]|nr:hypothetical protein [Chloroflexota bacterium]